MFHTNTLRVLARLAGSGITCIVGHGAAVARAIIGGIGIEGVNR